MLFVFGKSLPRSLSAYFSQRAAADGHKVIHEDSLERYKSSEAYAGFIGVTKEELKDQPVVMFQSFAAANGQTANDFSVQLLMGAHTLKKYGAGPIWAINPFGPYARQDQEREGKLDSVGSEWFAQMMPVNGIVGYSTIEIHSELAKGYIEDALGEDNVFSIDPTDIILEDLAQFELYKPVVASPDKGANQRADILAGRLGADRFQIDKERKEVTNVTITGHRGDVKGRDVILVDDMIDTGGTIRGAIELLKDQGARRVFVYSAHPVLSEGWLEKLVQMNVGKSDAVVDRIQFVDTIDRSGDLDELADKYGSKAVEHIGFLSSAETLYDHVTNVVANNSKMKPKP